MHIIQPASSHLNRIMASKRGGGRVSGSANCNGRGHVNRSRGRGRGHQVDTGTSLPNTSNRAAILSAGLSHAGFDASRQECRAGLLVRRFRAHYGVGPESILGVWTDLKRHQPEKSHDLRYVFMAACWLKLYDTEEVMAGRWKYGEDHCRDQVTEYVERIRKLLPIKISFDGLNPNCGFLPVDTMHVRSHEFRCNPGSVWYSHKFNGPGVSFEVVSDPIEGKIRWINGPKPASTHDITILRGGQKGKSKHWDKKSLYFKMRSLQQNQDVKLVGDSAYDGQPDVVTTTKDAHKPATKAIFKRMKSMQETCFKRFKDFKILDSRFRHGKGTDAKLQKVQAAFEATAVLLQYDFENGHRLFEV